MANCIRKSCELQKQCWVLVPRSCHGLMPQRGLYGHMVALATAACLAWVPPALPGCCLPWQPVLISVLMGLCYTSPPKGAKAYLG